MVILSTVAVEEIDRTHDTLLYFNIYMVYISIIFKVILLKENNHYLENYKRFCKYIFFFNT